MPPIIAVPCPPDHPLRRVQARLSGDVLDIIAREHPQTRARLVVLGLGGAVGRIAGAAHKLHGHAMRDELLDMVASAYDAGLAFGIEPEALPPTRES